MYAIVLHASVTRQRDTSLLQPDKVPNWPFEHTSLELSKDLPECHGYDVVVVFVCMLTK
jgi:hypothetical protein